MTHVTPIVQVSVNNKMKKETSGPQSETLMIIRHFARVYEFEPARKRKFRNEHLN